MSDWIFIQLLLEQPVYQGAFKITCNSSSFEAILFHFDSCNCHVVLDFFFTSLSTPKKIKQYTSELSTLEQLNIFKKIIREMKTKLWSRLNCLPKKGGVFEVSDPSANTKHRARGHTKGKSNRRFSLCPLEPGGGGSSPASLLHFCHRTLLNDPNSDCPPLVQSYPGKCPYGNKAAADSPAFVNRSIVNLFISFTCQLS